MPLMLGIVLAALARVVHALWRFVWLRTRETWRRLAGSYRTGYALVPVGASPGGRVETSLDVASDPVYLPAQDGSVALVSAVAGVSSSMWNDGRRWTASSAVVDEILPDWVQFGPAGLAVLDVLRAAVHAPVTQIEQIVRSPDERDLDSLIAGDPWRTAIAEHLMGTAAASFQSRLADTVPGEILALHLRPGRVSGA